MPPSMLGQVMTKHDFEELKQYYNIKQRNRKDASGNPVGLTPEEELREWMKKNGRL